MVPDSRVPLAIITTTFLFLLISIVTVTNASYLDSWSDTAPKHRVVNFLQYVERYVPVADRIAVFDMDGTLTTERPQYMEVVVAFNKLCAKAKQHPKLMNHMPYRVVCQPGKTAADIPDHLIPPTLLQSYVGEDIDTYYHDVMSFLQSRTECNTPLGRTWGSLAFRPMLDLIHLLTDQFQFQVYIVSGSMTWFIRGFSSIHAPQAVPARHAIGTEVEWNTTVSNGNTTFHFAQEAKFFGSQNVKVTKANNIMRRIGQKPIFATGNTDGDLFMLRLVSGVSSYRTLGMVINHDDAQREFYYPLKHSDQLYREAVENKWIMVSMKNDFKDLFIENEPC